MKATGIVRRMDDLGRVVIPREIRRTLGLTEGTPFEIYLDNGGVCFVPYADSLKEEVAMVQRKVNDSYTLAEGNAATLSKVNELFNQIKNILKEY